MSKTGTDLARICRQLNTEGAQYVLVGNRAMQLHGAPGPAREIVLVIEPTLANLQRVLRGLAAAGLGMAQEWLGTELLGREVVVLGHAPRVDLLLSPPELRHEDALASSAAIEVDGVTIPAARLDFLLQVTPSTTPANLEDRALLTMMEQPAT